MYIGSTALCGKVDALLAHLSKHCQHVPSERKDWAKRVLQERRRDELQRQACNVTDPPSASSAPGDNSRSVDLASSSDQHRRKVRRTGTTSSVVDEQLSEASDGIEQSNQLSRTAPWPQWYQREFAADLCKLFIVANIAWYALEIPFVRHFFTKYAAQANLPGRKELSGRVLDEEADRVTKRMQSEVKGRYVTGQCDGWKNISKDHIIATIINAEYTVRLRGRSGAITNIIGVDLPYQHILHHEGAQECGEPP